MARRKKITSKTLRRLLLAQPSATVKKYGYGMAAGGGKANGSRGRGRGRYTPSTFQRGTTV